MVFLGIEPDRNCIKRKCNNINIVCKEKCNKPGEAAYVPKKEYEFYKQTGHCFAGKCNIYLCPDFANQSFTNKACIIIHELSHWCGATEKGAYYLSDMLCPPSGGGETITVTQ